MIILLDNGHGKDTPGKRSPDGRLREYAWAREIANAVHAKLLAMNYDCRIIVPEDRDISLRERCIRVNNICKKNKNCLLISIHCNAAGCNGWKNARGWSQFIYRGASQKSKILADCLCDEAEKCSFKIRKQYPDKSYWTAGFYILKNTSCPAVLTENLFQDNKEDVEFLLSEKGKEELINLHVNGIINYIKKIEK